MDPSFVSTGIWHDLSTLLRFLWVYIFFIINASFSFLLAHAILPTLVNSGQFPARIARLRPLLYLGALGSFVLALVFLAVTAVNADVIGRVWPRWWI